ncbi:DUF1127 domain-containing protein [Cereibacter changlensis]|uniref:DUF1127 domain-containing protein n=1 Tax=Cereibacter changlensis TaxID=402884 RepID=A0A4V5NNN3_9RHOB|nr:DUF1127 domain-containing protein [Cereibacter changlensis]TKA95797.1 DUF1127 domain-containing protein [Cereibacter changlensis]
MTFGTNATPAEAKAGLRLPITIGALLRKNRPSRIAPDRLDDHLLSDIGLRRDWIDGMAAALSRRNRRRHGAGAPGSPTA